MVAFSSSYFHFWVKKLIEVTRDKDKAHLNWCASVCDILLCNKPLTESLLPCYQKDFKKDLSTIGLFSVYLLSRVDINSFYRGSAVLCKWQVTPWYVHHVRANFISWVSLEIGVCFGFALIRLAIGLKHSRYFFNQSEVKINQSRPFLAFRADYMHFLRVLIGSPDRLCRLW